MLNDGFTASERTGNGSNATAGNREQRVDNALTGDHRHRRRKFFFIRSAFTDGPSLQHFQVLLALCRFDDRDCFVDGEVAFFDFFNRPFDAERHHDFHGNDFVFFDGADNVARRHFVACFFRRHETPFFIVVDSGDIDTP